MMTTEESRTDRIRAEGRKVLAERYAEIRDGMLDGRPWFFVVYAEATRRVEEGEERTCA